ncbi:MAG: DoxX family protein, partial [Cytophagaceae bacterium]|nr:DoxX family protein [Cytophagaceae bacterium]
FRYRDYAPFFLRLAFGFQLVKVSWPNALMPAENLPQFESYLTSLGFPFPPVGVVLATYTEFIGGLLILLGLWTRWAALLLVINFSMALIFAHLIIADSYQNTMPSANLVAVNLFLLFNGPGKLSLDHWRGREPR